MKKTVTLALTILLVLGLLSGCANDTPADNAESTENTNTTATAENFSDEMKIPYATDLSRRTARTLWSGRETMRILLTSPTRMFTTWSPRIP